MAFKPIEIIINAKDNASAVFGRLQTLIAAVGAAILSYLGVSAFAGAVKGAANFEEAMSRVKAATDGTAEEMAALRKAAEDAGANTKYTSVEAAGALENLAKAGLSAKDSVAALPAVLSLAQAGDIALGQASEYVTKAVMGMGLSFNDAGRVADVLAKGPWQTHWA
jgi:TP901 family phage tail tape measure protein